MKIYSGDSLTQLAYQVGSAIREAIDLAYWEYMKYACITTTVIMGVGFPAVVAWRNYRLDQKQNKGQMM